MVDFGKNLINSPRPNEGLRFTMMNTDISFNRLDQIPRAHECTPPNPFPGQFGKTPLSSPGGVDDPQDAAARCGPG
jgi:hypothetical protein